ncbi:MAG: hypothetical protein JHC33_02680, partial [Ignisphaera sp.]|nr:hypothetical protein [Ignisphaera sp.]
MIIGPAITTIANPKIAITGNTFLGVLTHANSGSDKTYTFPNFSGTVALTSSTLVSTRVPFADANGLLTDSANLAYTVGTASTGYLTIANTTASSSLTSGALVVAGGIATSGLINTANGINFNVVASPTAGLSLALILSGGNLSVGTYIYAVSYITPTGETGITTTYPSITTDGTHLQVTVTIPVSGDSRVTGRKIYRTKVGDASSYLCVLAIVADNSTTTYVDNIADTSLPAYRINIGNTTSGLTVNGTTILSFSSTTNTTYFASSAYLTSPTAVLQVGSGSTKGTSTAYVYLGGFNNTTPYPQLVINSPTANNFGIGPNSTSNNLQIGESTFNSWNSPSSTMQVILNSTTASTSTTTGALVVAGGIGIAKSANFGSNIALASDTSKLTLGVSDGSATSASFISLDTFNTVTPYPQVNINWPNTGCIGIGHHDLTTATLRIGYASSPGTWGSASSTMTVIINSTTVSSSPTTGALVVAGGFGLAGKMNMAASQGIVIPSGAPGVTTNTLYQVSGSLY